MSAPTGLDRVPVMVPWLGEEEARAAAEAVLSGWVAQGPRVAAFEAAFAERVGAAHGVAVSSCTTALHLALVAAGVGPGDEVVVPSLSFIATANAVRYVGAEPVFADVEPGTGNLTPVTVDAVRTDRTAAVIGVHQGGRAAGRGRAAAGLRRLGAAAGRGRGVRDRVHGGRAAGRPGRGGVRRGRSTRASSSPPARAAWSPRTTRSGRRGCGGCASTG